MKKVALKILLLFVLVFTINSIVHKAFVPYDWGDDVLRVKNEFYNSHQAQFNTVFVGGSLFYRHLDPYQFDSLNAVNGIETSSFNYGVDGNNHIKQMILIDHLLDQKQTHLKYIFFALSSNSYFEDRNMHTQKFVTWINFKSLKYAIKVAMDEDASLGQRLKVVYQYTLSWLENRLNAGTGLNLVKFELTDKKKYKGEKMRQLHLGVHQDGFKPYYFPEDVDSAQLSYADQLLYWSNNFFKRNHDDMDTIMDMYYKDYLAYEQNGAHLNQAMVDCYMDLIEKANKKGIQLIALIPPRSRLPYSVLLPVYEALPEKNRMNFGNPNEYPAFYDYDNTFNFYHMNPKGAAIYTEEVSKAFNKIVQQ